MNAAQDKTATESASITREDPGFPAELAAIPDPPERLYRRGRLPPMPRVAVVGARRSDEYGLRLARELGHGLARHGVAVVSGGAEGVDTAALEGCLEGGGRPVVVTGTGLDVVYPAANRALFERVAGAGALLSELGPGTPGLPAHFARRNRLVSGLALGVVVVRAALRSGSLITAREAVRQGRPVMAVPGSAGEVLSAGAHRLLRQGARLVEGPADVLAVLGLGARPDQLDLELAQEALELAPEETRLLEALSGGGLAIDELAERAGLEAARVSAALLQLELKGLVCHRPGMRYERCAGRAAGAGEG